METNKIIVDGRTGIMVRKDHFIVKDFRQLLSKKKKKADGDVKRGARLGGDGVRARREAFRHQSKS